MDIHRNLDYFRRNFGKLRVLLPLIALFCWLDYALIRAFLDNILFRPPNQAVGPLGAPFAGFFLLGFYLVFFLIGFWGTVIGFAIKKYGWILFSLALTFMVGTVIYPFFLSQIDSDLVLGMYGYDDQVFVGTWEDDQFRLILRDDNSYILNTNTSESNNITGSWQVRGERLVLVRKGAKFTSYLVAIKNETLFLSYSYREDIYDPDEWNGNLGLMKMPSLSEDVGE